MRWDEITRHPGAGRDGALRFKYFHTDSGRWTLREEHGRYLYLIDPSDRQVGMANVMTGYWLMRPAGDHAYRSFNNKNAAIEYLLECAGLAR